MICRYGINERIERYGKLLSAIEMDELYADSSPLQLSDKERRKFVNELNGDVYRQVPKRRLYILLRLDSKLSDGSASYDHGVVSIEHVLPQNPTADSKWCEWFSTQDERDRWVHRVGNLLLLNHKKNSSASNYEFEKKKTAYFMKGGVSPFPLTTQAVGETEWSLEVVERRQRQLLEHLKQVWRINVEMIDEPLDEADNDNDDDEDDSGEKRAGFHAEIIPRLEQRLGIALVKQSRVCWVAADDSVLVSCQVSKKFDRKDMNYWYGLKRSTKEALENHDNAYCAFVLGSSDKVVMIPFSDLANHLDDLHTSPDQDGNVRHWHIQFRERNGQTELLVGPGKNAKNVSDYFLTTS